MRRIEDQAFLWLLVGTSIAFGLIIWPYFGAVLWGVVAAIAFAPLYRRLSRLTGQRAGLAAIITVVVVILLVIVPLMLIASSLVVEANSLYGSIQSERLDVNQYFKNVGDMLPAWAKGLLDRFDLTNFGAIRDRLSQLFSQFLQLLVSRAVTVGQSTFEFIISLSVMLYLLFFLLRDGSSLTRRIKDAIPLRASHRDELFEKFVVVIRATVKGSILVAALQGALGGLAFWLLGIHAPVLWAVLMAFFALLPAVGAGIVWLPVALYLLISGAVWKAAVLVAFGMLVIGLVDNILRPILVGKSTRMPDYLVLISTLGGIAVAGLNGFVIGPVVAAMFIAVWDIFSATRGASGKPAGQSGTPGQVDQPPPEGESNYRDQSAR